MTTIAVRVTGATDDDVNEITGELADLADRHATIIDLDIRTRGRRTRVRIDKSEAAPHGDSGTAEPDGAGDTAPADATSDATEPPAEVTTPAVAEGAASTAEPPAPQEPTPPSE